jgi:hypothetical protein
MRVAAIFLSVLTIVFAGCAGERQQDDQQAYGPEQVAERRAVLEQIVVEWELDAGSDETRALRQSLLEYERSTAELEKALPALTKDKDYYRLRCEYLDAIIELTRVLEPGPEESP